jgi:molybdopterin synthase sulfur carrier subunit
MLVKYFATYRTITGRRTEDVPASEDMLALLRSLSDTYGDELRGWLLSPDGTDKGVNAIVLVNGRHIEHLGGVHTKLAETDTVALFPLVAGG